MGILHGRLAVWERAALEAVAQAGVPPLAQPADSMYYEPEAERARLVAAMAKGELGRRHGAWGECQGVHRAAAARSRGPAAVPARASAAPPFLSPAERASQERIRACSGTPIQSWPPWPGRVGCTARPRRHGHVQRAPHGHLWYAPQLLLRAVPRAVLPPRAPTLTRVRRATAAVGAACTGGGRKAVGAAAAAACACGGARPERDDVQPRMKRMR